MPYIHILNSGYHEKQAANREIVVTEPSVSALRNELQSYCARDDVAAGLVRVVQKNLGAIKQAAKLQEGDSIINGVVPLMKMDRHVIDALAQAIANINQDNTDNLTGNLDLKNLMDKKALPITAYVKKHAAEIDKNSTCTIL